MDALHKTGAFTLVEVAIALTIIGFLAGGIVVTRDLIRNSQIQSVINDEDRYKKAIQLFKEKYNYLPGDMPTATTFWGTDAGGCPAAYNSSPKTATCNGDGNGRIDYAWAGDLEEWFRAWQHLANGGFIQSAFPGTAAPSAAWSFFVPGSNIPASSLPGAGWTILYYYGIPFNGLWPGQYGHLLAFGAPMNMRVAQGYPGDPHGNYTYAPILTPGEALNIDQKLDDGMPGTGNVRAWRTSALPNCTVTDTSQTAQSYNSANSGQLCALVFLLGF